MRTRGRNQPIVGSLVDRLLDDDPQHREEPARPVGDDLRRLELSVCRDLENLLNTRRRCQGGPPECRDLEVSLVEYGVPDLAGLNMSMPSEREQTRLEIERAIRRFEPRLRNVTVTVLANADPFDRTLRFRITGALRVEPEPEPVVFDSEVEPSSTAIEVKPAS